MTLMVTQWSLPHGENYLLVVKQMKASYYAELDLQEVDTFGRPSPFFKIEESIYTNKVLFI